ncbi:MAG: endonuclease [Candidatus Cloacimonetes bacterium]|nr:endonuclease [Candidatus Cloacimonadota bacterium]MCF7813271.1 endonuclease [Candidatus Cloacimonadota bacterium]MCF7867346.1 endonuclease [Candidatus Cloacimonadota bacterium]MCF7882780.1 endonuclease [Candidatus Cloacimonadota bacterium]
MKYKILLILFLAAVRLFADPPPGYYDGTENLYGEDLKAVLNDIIDGHTEVSYSAAWNALKDTDKDPDNPNNVILLYTGWSVTNTGYPTWNREHVWAKSHGDFGTTIGPGTDIHHLRPADPDVNSARGNKDFDNGGTQHSIATGCYYDDDSWEPRDEVKGDVARMIFYMATRYEGENGEIDLEAVDAVNTYPNPQHGKLSTLLEWNIIDPPDDFEENRNDVIFEDYQGNRNPFVDDPNFANLIWSSTIADFEGFPTEGNAPLTVDFTDLSQSPSTIEIWEWDFDGDGTIDSNQQNPQFIYQEDGVYSVTLTVQNDLGDEASTTKLGYILVGSSNIPITILAESFEDGLNWAVYDAYSSYSWERTNDIVSSSHPDNVPDGEWYVYMNNYGSNAGADDWLISPVIDLSDLTYPYFTFFSWTKYSDNIPGLEVMVSTDYNGSGDPQTAIWQNLNPVLPSANSQTWMSSGQVDLSAYIDENIYIAFHYESSGFGASSCTAWAVDNIIVEGFEVQNSVNEIIPANISLSNYPNPFNPATTITFNVTQTSSYAKIEIYNLKGQKVKTLPVILSPESLLGKACGTPTSYSVVWNGKDHNNKQVSSGIYYYKLNILNSPIKKMLLLK